ncbi:uncharacterized protein LOC131497439 isoform X3 [Neofelis nebulosa]|uniref:uncharacterized protein LOC131497439 isoform X3 n=1 Tax=Neofelis nebulosa TaxID=61452 RepID=UPI00272B9F17|nr:uncharacterized protein LOC131497439 isoform X3 [Neofelis nebulosa]
MAIRLTAEELNDVPVASDASDVPVDGMDHHILGPDFTIQGEIIDVDKMDSPLQTMGMNLSEEEINDLTRDLPADVHGKVEMRTHMDGMKPFTGGKVKVNNLDTVLENLGIKLTQKEHEDVTENLPLTANGKVELSTLMDAVATVTGGEVNVSDIQSILEKMGIELTDKECSKLKKYLPVNAVGKVYQNRLMDGVKTLKGKKIDANDLLKVLGALGIELPEKELVRLRQTVPIDAAGKVYKNGLLDGVKSVKGGMVKANNLDNVLENLGIELTEKEREALAENLPLSANGKMELKKLMEAVETITD